MVKTGWSKLFIITAQKTKKMAHAGSKLERGPSQELRVEVMKVSTLWKKSSLCLPSKQGTLWREGLRFCCTGDLVHLLRQFLGLWAVPLCQVQGLREEGL